MTSVQADAAHIPSPQSANPTAYFQLLEFTMSTIPMLLLRAGLLSFCTAAMQTPLRDPSRTPKHMTSTTYNQIPALVFYKTYPVHAPGHEPSGCMDQLRRAEPETAFDPTRLHTPGDWATAGAAIFDAPTFFENPARASAGPQWFPAAGVPVAKDGSYPFARYVVRKKGEVELGGNSCSSCYTRVLPDGSVLKGAQGNNPLDRVLGASFAALAKQGHAAEVLDQV